MARTMVAGLCSGLITATAAAQLPQNPNHGPGITVDPLAPNGMNITSTISNGIIEWQSFDIGNGLVVNFFLNGANERILNKVTGPGVSNIDGTLWSNGIVYIVNPAGVMFGPNATVDVAGIYAAAGTISDADFQLGNDTFTNVTGSVVNHGTITAQQLAHLVGRHVANHGLINVGNGVITMSAGDSVIITEDLSGKIQVTATGGGAFVGPPGTHAVENNGVGPNGGLEAPGGQIVMAAGDFYSLAIRNAGSIDASGGGQLTMQSAAGDIRHTGAMTSGADSVLLTTPGDIYLGGNVAGDVIEIDGAVTLTDDVTVDGGQLVHFTSTIDGTNAGDESLNVNTAGGGTTQFDGAIGLNVALETLATNADGMTILGGDVFATQDVLLLNELSLAAGGNQSITAQAGTLHIGGPATSTAGDVTLVGGTLVQLDSGIDVQAGSLDVTGVLTAQGDLQASQDVTINDDATVDGNVTALAGAIDFGGTALLSGDVTAGTDVTFQGATTLNGAGNQTVTAQAGTLHAQSTVSSTNGDLNLVGGTAVNLDGDVDVTGGSLDVTGLLNAQGSLTAGQNVTLNDNATIDGDVNATAGNAHFLGEATLGGNVTAGQNVTFDNMATFVGAGSQSVAAQAGTLHAQSTLVSNSGNLSLTGGTSVLLDDAVDVLGGGSLAVTGPLTATSTLTADQNITLNNTATVTGDVTATAGNALFRGDTTLLSNVTAGNNITFDALATFAGVGDQQADAQGGILTALGDVDKTTSGGLTLLGAGGITLQGNASTTDGGLTFANAVTFTGGDQQVSAAGGALTAQNNLTKTTAGDLTIAGDLGLDLFGNVDVQAGGLEFANEARFVGAGNQQAAATDVLIAQAQVTKTTAGDLSLVSSTEIRLLEDVATSNGALTLDGPVAFVGSGDQVAQAVGGQLVATNDVTKSTPGLLTLEGTQGIDLAGDVTTTQGGLDLLNDVAFTGSGDQAVTVAGIGHAHGNLSKTSSGDLTLDAAGGFDIDGNVETSDGDLDLADETRFIGTGDQHATAGQGVLVGQALIEKLTAGSLTLGGDNGIELVSHVSTTSGDLVLLDMTDFVGSSDQTISAHGGRLFLLADASKSGSGGLMLFGDNGIELAGNVQSAVGSVTLDGDVDLVGTSDQALESLANELIALGSLIKSGSGALILTGDSGIDVHGDVAVQAGDLVVNSDLNLAGSSDQSLAASGQMTLAAALNKPGTGNVEIAAGGGITVGGPIAVTLGDLDILSALDLLGGAVTTGGNQTYSAVINLGGDTILSGQDVNILGGLVGNGHSLVIDVSGFASLVSSLNGLSSLLTTGSGVTELDTDIAADDIAFENAVVLLGDISLEALGSILFGSTIDGGSHLAVSAGDDVEFVGDVGGQNALGSLDVEAGNLIIFHNALVRANGDILLNADGRSDTPLVATIVSHGGELHLESLGGMVATGRNEKLTAFGTLRITAPTAQFGDLTAAGDILVDANQIVLLLRDAGDVLNFDGTTSRDRGLDLVAGGSIILQGVITLDGDGQVIVATASGPDNVQIDLDELRFQLLLVPEGMDFADLLVGANGQTLDLRAQGPTSDDVSEALAGAVPEDDEREDVSYGVTLTAAAKEALEQQLQIFARDMRPDEVADLVSGVALLNDVPGKLEPAPPDLRVSVPRVDPRLVDQALAIYDLIREQIEPGVGDDEVSFQDAVSDAWAAFMDDVESPEQMTQQELGLAFRSYLDSAEHEAALAGMQRLEHLLSLIQRLGLTPLEMQAPTREIVNRSAPDEIRTQYMDAWQAAVRRP